MLARVVAEAKTHMHGPNELAWRRRLHDLLPDVMATWDDPDPATALRLIADMQWFWYTGAMYAPVLPRMEDVIARGQGHEAGAGAHVTLGWMWHRLGEIATAQGHFEQAIRSSSPGNPVGQLATIGIAYCVMYEGKHIERGIAMFDDVIAGASRQDSVSHELVAAWFGKGLMLAMHGDMAPAQPCFLHALEMAERINDFHALGMCLMQLATINLAQGDADPALWKLQEAIPQILAGGDLATVALALDILASTLMAMSQSERAALALAHSERLRDRLGIVRSPLEQQAIDDLRIGLPPLPHLTADTANEQVLDLLDTSGTQEAEATPAAMLSPRELDVLELTARGYRGAEIAERLFISPNTVKRHMANIRRKLGVKSQAAAIATIREMSSSGSRR
jgi:DNA-binding CsgD family transcriptional regulator